MNLLYKNWEERNEPFVIYYGTEDFMSQEKTINPLASPSAGAPALKYGDDIITETTSPDEVKGLMENLMEILDAGNLCNLFN